MNSPLEPASPLSSASSESLILDDREIAPTQEIVAPATGEPSSQSQSSGPKPAAKRRLPAGPGRAAGNRDPKTRRREEAGPRKGAWEGKDSSRNKEDFVDVAMSEAYRQRIGDPFDEDIIKRAS